MAGPAISHFGYTPGHAESIIAATGAALTAPYQRSRQIFNYSEVTDRLLAPQNCADAKI